VGGGVGGGLWGVGGGGVGVIAFCKEVLERKWTGASIFREDGYRDKKK